MHTLYNWVDAVSGNMALRIASSMQWLHLCILFQISSDEFGHSVRAQFNPLDIEISVVPEFGNKMTQCKVVALHQVYKEFGGRRPEKQ